MTYKHDICTHTSNQALRLDKEHTRPFTDSYLANFDMTIDAPRTLRSLEAIEQRKKMLTEPHIVSLMMYVKELRTKHPNWEFQDFDPLDGGIHADMLFLLEKPGPKTSPSGKKQGSGFISRNNDDPTAETIFEFMRQAEISRSRTILWNVIPGWNGTTKTNSGELQNGIEELRHLLPLLPNLQTVVLVGRKAQRALSDLKEHRPSLRIFTSAHPARQVYRFNRDQWEDIPKQWRRAGLAQDEIRAKL